MLTQDLHHQTTIMKNEAIHKYLDTKPLPIAGHNTMLEISNGSMKVLDL